MKCSLGISNFLKEISSLSHSVLFLCFSALITEEGFLTSPCYSLELCIQMFISFLFSFAFSSLLFTAICKASSDNYFAFLHFFFLGMVLITPSLFGWAVIPSVLVRESHREVWDRRTVRRPHADRGRERSAAATGMLTACRGWKCKEGTLPETFWRKEGLTDNDDVELLACRTGRE